MKLEGIEQDIKTRIIQALIDEYSKNGYSGASTNMIVKQAGISKGSLFNYIGNKEEQYIFIVDYVMQFFIETLSKSMIDIQLPGDYFDQLLLKSQIKLQLALEYPKEYKLLLDAYLEPAEEVKKYMASQYAIFSKTTMLKGSENFDAKLLKTPEDKEKLIEIVFHLISGYSDSYIKNCDTLTIEAIPGALEEMTRELDTYFKALKRAFFK
ncbi:MULTISPECIES: TetR/AcrR family transcriptional regulator [unclassified Fusibacter]|uniref:TetR/AcrR family transcriptional regulator n=1 Tax=unclassified Fusibacter TaxID=2624464 RepID=UPI0010110D1E|nr:MULTISPECIES: TetR/AcrR family transcriptional regulator [unclassified Fusibacter]MCK8060723.1 TetR/AcrR family transcriptional regulator [Fusibacter sp. A2]NPE23018.1 TetR/AcrR family transcriptional regulator [Fusibacter sp. A1]RXV59690.1 TetR/AcrR family transcriptional regulator [Fusibacter sp. A1]